MRVDLRGLGLTGASSTALRDAFDGVLEGVLVAVRVAALGVGAAACRCMEGARF